MIVLLNAAHLQNNHTFKNSKIVNGNIGLHVEL